jgi:HSP20 family molecular chaperone IbpA
MCVLLDARSRLSDESEVIGTSSSGEGRSQMVGIDLDVDRELNLLHEDRGRLWVLRGLRGTDRPPIDVTESARSIVVSTPLVGASPDDLDVEVGDGELTIDAGHEFSETSDGACLILERRHDPLHLAFGLPEDADRERIAATLMGGALIITIPRSVGSPRHQRLRVSSASGEAALGGPQPACGQDAAS